MQLIQSKLALLLGVLLIAAPVALAETRTCEALVVAADGLWMVSERGEARRILQDERGVNAPRFSPNGERIAYVRNFRFGEGEVVATIVVAGIDGRVLREIAVPLTAGINDVLDLGWLSENRLWTEGHVHPSSSLYHEWPLESDRPEHERWGSRFAPSPDGRSVAYVAHVPHGAPESFRSSIVMVDDRQVYPLDGDDRPHRVIGAIRWIAADRLAFADAPDGNPTLVVVDARAQRVLRRVPLGANDAVRGIETAPDGTMAIERGGRLFAIDERGKIRDDEASMASFPPRFVNVGTKRLGVTASRDAVVADDVRCHP